MDLTIHSFLEIVNAHSCMVQVNVLAAKNCSRLLKSHLFVEQFSRIYYYNSPEG